MSATDTTRAAASPPPGGEDEANRSFLKKYAEATELLKAGLKRLHVRGRLDKSFTAAGRPPERTTLECFAKDGKRRVDIINDRSDEPSTNANVEPPEVMLWTPDVAAHFIDPGTTLAWARYQSEKPNELFERRFRSNAWSYLTASYSYLNCLADGWGVLDSVVRDEENNGWLRVSCRLISPGTGKRYGTMDVWLDDAHDYVARKVRRLTRSSEMRVDLGSYARTADGGWLPGTQLVEIYGAQAEKAESAGTAGPLQERIEFALLGVESLDFPDSCFTLASLGGAPPRGSWMRWLLLALAGVLLIAVVVSRRKRSADDVAPADPSAVRHEPGGSS